MATTGAGFITLSAGISPTNDVADGTLRFLDPAAPCNGIIYAQGTLSPISSVDAILIMLDLNSGLQTVIDGTPASYWIYSVGPCLPATTAVATLTAAAVAP